MVGGSVVGHLCSDVCVLVDDSKSVLMSHESCAQR